MSWPKRFVFVRHGESTGNIATVDERAGFCVPSYNYPLTACGRLQAKLTGEYLRDRFGPFGVYYTSYYRRSRETMGLMFPNVPDEKIYQDPRLAEAQRGIWHTMTHEQIQERFPEEFRRKELEGLYHYRPLGGENWPDVELRIHSFLGTITRDYEDEDLVVCGHGNWFILFQRLQHRFGIKEALRRYHGHVVANASVTIYEKDIVKGKSRLVLKEENIMPWSGRL